MDVYIKSKRTQYRLKNKNDMLHLKLCFTDDNFSLSPLYIYIYIYNTHTQLHKKQKLQYPKYVLQFTHE